MKVDEKELNALSQMSYKELCDFLVRKYGPVNEPYFINETCKTVNHRIKRTREGLFIHHVGEKDFIELANPKYALIAPYDYQLPKNLVYCNYFEHLFLHIRIVKEFLSLKKVLETNMAVGIGGLVNFILPEIIDYINGYQYQREYMCIALSIIDGHETFFIKTLFDLQKMLEKPKYSQIMIKLYWPKRVNLFLGKMTKSGRFYDLVDDFTYQNNIYKYNEYEEIKNYLIKVVEKKPSHIVITKSRHYSGNDNCCFYIYYKTKKRRATQKSFAYIQKRK